MSKKKIILTTHAKGRMVGRKIDFDTLKDIVWYPNHKEPPIDKEQKYIKQIGNKEYFAIVEELKNHFKIITVGYK